MPRTGRPRLSTDVVCTCKTCGKDFTIPSWDKQHGHYCSRVCFFASRKGVPRHDLRANPVFNTCAFCGKEFQVGGHGRPKYYQQYCSQICMGSSHPRPGEMTDLEIAWLAGLFEGEGSIVFSHGKLRKSVTITISNTILPLLEKVLEVVGTGAIQNMTRYKVNPKHSPAWLWRCHGENARILLERMMPWFIVKKQRAEIALGIRPLSEWVSLKKD